jgi:glyoxylate reductase
VNNKPKVVADGPPFADAVVEFLGDQVELLPWSLTETGAEGIDGIYTYGHLTVDGPILDRLPGIRIVSNYGVGVDHIDVQAAAARGIPVGNTPSILDGATADMGFALLLAAGRRVMEGDRYARSPEFLHYDPGYMLGRDVHSTTLGIVGLGAIGRQVARRALGFDMKVLYHNRRRRLEVEQELGVEYRSLDELLAESDYAMLCCPLTVETRNLIDAAALAKMKPSSVLVNIARGGVVDTQALYEALRDKKIYAAGLDVTEPEPLPRGHPMLALDNVTIVPHLGSATIETRREMARNSVENLMRGLRGEKLLNQVQP